MSGKGSKKELNGGDKTNIFWSHFGQNSIKNAIQNSFKNRSRKNMEINAKRLPKWSRKRCQNSLKTNAKTGIEKDLENHVFLQNPQKFLKQYRVDRHSVSFAKNIDLQAKDNKKIGKSSKLVKICML